MLVVQKILKFVLLPASMLAHVQGFHGKLASSAVLASLSLIPKGHACEGPQGETGPAGPAGPAGAAANETVVAQLTADLAAALARIEALEAASGDSVQFEHFGNLANLYTTENDNNFTVETLKTRVGILPCIMDGDNCTWDLGDPQDAKCCDYQVIPGRGPGSGSLYWGCVAGLSASEPDTCQEVCFPGDAMVEVQEQGMVRLDEIKEGDMVRTKSGFSKLYGFGHRRPSDSAYYYQLKTADPATKALEISGIHQVFVGAFGKTKYAKDVVVGDQVMLPSQELVTITEITQVLKQGVYQPHTYDGTLYVDGVLTSNYCESVSIKLFGHELVDMHTFKYMVYAPVRMLSRFGFGASHQKEDGRLTYNAWVKATLTRMVPGYLEAHKEGTNLLNPQAPYFWTKLALVAFWILPLYALEQFGILFVSAVVGSLFLVRRAARKGKKKIVL